jgi:hypothetical protein
MSNLHGATPLEWIYERALLFGKVRVFAIC